jgi:hypothetical protein
VGYEGSMMGSGIYSEEVTREIVCKERCMDCDEKGYECPAYWNEDFATDDWGNIEQEVTCKSCGHSFDYKEEREYD